jgi:hypothetical protein
MHRAPNGPPVPARAARRERLQNQNKQRAPIGRAGRRRCGINNAAGIAVFNPATK